jgi:hypothetical protein
MRRGRDLLLRISVAVDAAALVPGSSPSTQQHQMTHALFLIFVEPLLAALFLIFASSTHQIRLVRILPLSKDVLTEVCTTYQAGLLAYYVQLTLADNTSGDVVGRDHLVPVVEYWYDFE